MNLMTIFTIIMMKESCAKNPLNLLENLCKNGSHVIDADFVCHLYSEEIRFSSDPVSINLKYSEVVTRNLLNQAHFEAFKMDKILFLKAVLDDLKVETVSLISFERRK